MFRVNRAVLATCLLLVAGCGAREESPPAADVPPDVVPPDDVVIGAAVAPIPVAVTLGPEQKLEVDRLQALVDGTRDLTADGLLAARAVPFRTDLGYRPLEAVNLDLVQASALALNDAELAALAADGFVVTDRKKYPHFAWGYQEIYSQDLPVFISADAILQAVHQSYDQILASVEVAALVPELDALLASMRARLAPDAALEAQTRTQVDLFLAVAASLLHGELAAPVAGASAADVERLVSLAEAASGFTGLTLFGVERDVDFSQFLPRGHYADIEILRRYFRAMMWLGRIDLPLVRTNPGTGKPELMRSAVAGAFALRGLMDAEALARWGRIDAVVRAFVGEPDSMGPPDVDRLQADLGVTGGDLSTVTDEALASAIVAGAYGSQRILGQIVMQAPHAGTWPVDATFLVLGQRYVLDSHVFSNVVYDRANPDDPSVPKRMMPDPLDVAYAALGNDQAAALLGPDLALHRYAPQLEAMRRLADAHDTAFWDANLYNRWLGALRALSPGPALATAVPAVAATERWGRRVLQTQLASWAQLRHDTLLYAKPSYTSGVLCEFPDAYVEPNPAFFARIEAFADAGGALVASLPFDPAGDASYLAARVSAYFERLRQAAGILRAMAEHQATGTPHTAEHLAFVNRAVSTGFGCGGPPWISGWYADLFFDAGSAADFDPTIADVHTQPTDEGGAFVGRVLHVGTGNPRLMVMTVETCSGPRAYAGVVSSYHEIVTGQLQRLTDQTWASQLQSGASPPPVPWLADLVVR